ncbi:MAG: radical SAM protein, partial [Promethearchaeota archaeon]
MKTLIAPNNKRALIARKGEKTVFYSKDYNFIFNRKTGFFARWGKTQEDDPDFSPFGPEIADIEIATSCKGVGTPCNFCYKKNNPNGEYMTFETFKKLFAKLPPIITQIAFGIGDIDSNPDMWKIFDYCNENKVIPNVTVNGAGITNKIADKLVSKCGAVAVSYYDKDLTFNTIKKLTDRGMEQVNIHFMISDETFDKARSLIDDRQNDKRLSKMNAIVFLSLKKKGRAKNRYTQLSQEKFNELVNFALSNNVAIGFDSCSAFKFLRSVGNDSKYETYIEPCESSLFSSYFNVKGDFYPCSFMEGEENWEDGIKLE